MHINKHTCRAMLSGLAVALAAFWVSPASAQSGPTLRCIDVNQSVPMNEYAVALLSNTIRIDPSNRFVTAKVTLLLRSPSSLRELYPLILEESEAYVQCKGTENIKSSELPTVTMEIQGVGGAKAKDLFTRLGNLPPDPGIIKSAKTAPSWPPFLLFSKNTFQPVGRTRDVAVLFRNYFRAGPDAAFLASVPYPVKMEFDGIMTFTYPVIPPDGTAANDRGGGTQSGNTQQQQSGQPQTQPQPQSQSPPQQVAAKEKDKAGGKGAPKQQPQPQQQPQQGRAPAGGNAPVAGGVIAQPRPVDITRVDVKIRFGSHQDQWDALLSREPGLIETFGFCDNPVSLGGGNYKLACDVRPDRKVPVRIKGFEELLIDAEGTTLDDQLRVARFSTPYPKEWKRPQTEFVTIDAGPLREVLTRHIPLSQGITGCQVEMAGLSIGDIVSGGLRWQANLPPCTAYTVSFADVPLASDARIESGCIEGSNEAVGILNNKATCWSRSGRAGEIVLMSRLLNGFSNVKLNIPGPTDVVFDYGKLAAALLPSWPYAPGIAERGESPTYKATEVRYEAGNSAPCGGPINPPVNGVQSLPSLQAAGCSQVPRSMAVKLEQDGGFQNNSTNVPAEAFAKTIDDRIELTTAQPNKTVPLDQLKLPLGVQFSAEDARTFNAQFGAGIGNSSLAGVYLFQDDCTGKRGALNGAFVSFNAPYSSPAAKGPYKWPIRAAVYDSGEEALTQCSIATVGVVPGQTSYLTFSLKGQKAAGPRRAIVISMNPSMGAFGGKKAYSEGLRTFVDQISAEVARGAPLSPINVILVDGAGNLKSLFTGERAAIDPAKVKTLIAETQEDAAPAAPDFRLLRFMPELKKDSVENFDSVVFVMDGSEVSPDNKDFLAGLTNRIGKPDSVQLLILGNNCPAWQQQNQNFRCTQLPRDVGPRADLMAKTFGRLINPPADGQPQNPQGEPQQAPQQVPPPLRRGDAAPAPVATPASQPSRNVAPHGPKNSKQ